MMGEKAVIARSPCDDLSAEALAKAEAIHSFLSAARWIASSLSSGAHSRDPVARNDGDGAAPHKAVITRESG
jgi:hypothetical protein